MPLHDRISIIVNSAETHAARSVNSAQVLANWLIGKEIIQEEQDGKERATYGEKIIPNLAKRLKKLRIKGYGSTNLWSCRQFHQDYPHLLSSDLPTTLVSQFKLHTILHSLGGASPSSNEILHSASGELHNTLENKHLDREPSLNNQFKPGHFTPNLSWTHYRNLLKTTSPEARSFYEIETIRNSWSARELERQINSLLYQRIAKSKDQEGLLKLSKEGHKPQSPVEIFIS